MKKRVLAVLLMMALALGLLPVTASALDMSYKTWAQYDSRWGSMSMSSTGSGHSMAREGCYVTAIAKLLVHAGQQDPAKFTPKECLQGMLAHGMLSADGGVYYGSFNNSFLPNYGKELVKETSDAHSAWGQATAVNAVSGWINEGYYVIVCVNNKSTGNTHYMLVDNIRNGDIYVMDNEEVVPLYGTWKYSGGVIDQVKFRYTGSRKYPAYENPIDGGTGDNSGGSTVGTTKTQYRYHRYEDGYGEYAVCAYYGNSLSTAAGPMHVKYTDWLDSPLPVVKANDQDYLVHPYQGASCANAGCLSSDPYQTYRYRDSAGKIWYYEESRTVTVEAAADPTPNCDKGHTWGEWEIVEEATCEEKGQQERVCELCGETETKTVNALGHDYQVKQETETATLYACTRCGDSYLEETPGKPPEDEKKGTFETKNTYREGMFTDVQAGNWFTENVRTAYELGLMEGVGGGRFAPGNSVTIAQAVTMAARIHSIYHTGSDQFPRYDGGNWYDPYVNYARDNGIIYENYAFGRPATREEFVHILAAALPEEELAALVSKADFADQADITYQDDVALLRSAGVIDGVKENGEMYFKPWNSISRAQAAAIITRLVKPELRKG